MLFTRFGGDWPIESCRGCDSVAFGDVVIERSVLSVEEELV